MNELEQRVARAIIDAEEDAEGQGAKFIPAALTEDHSGDCTKDPWTCARCYAEQYIEIARAALKAHAEWLREPKPADAEVWRCPTCDTIIDRQAMAGAAHQEDQSHD